MVQNGYKRFVPLNGKVLVVVFAFQVTNMPRPCPHLHLFLHHHRHYLQLQHHPHHPLVQGISGYKRNMETWLLAPLVKIQRAWKNRQFVSSLEHILESCLSYSIGVWSQQRKLKIILVMILTKTFSCKKCIFPWPFTWHMIMFRTTVPWQAFTFH